MKNILLPLYLLMFSISLQAQVIPPTVNVQQIKVDDLTDDQVRQIVSEMKKNNVGLDQIDNFASQKGIAPSEAAKLKARISSLNLGQELTSKERSPQAETQVADRSIIDGKMISARDIQPLSLEDVRRQRIYGSELFNNKNLTFEPNLRIPTPPNYQIAADDELIVDVYGYSEVQHKLKVSPEGYVRIPYVGPVYVSGLTIIEARERITKQLSTVYGGIKSGNTSVQLTLGNIRSIRVLLIGEVVRPGSYTLPSLATIANALYVSGGPNENGSFRDIQVIRNGTAITKFDLYDFLRNGDLTNNIVLRDQDIIKVTPYQSRVEIVGEVKRSAIFEVKEGETLQDVINLAGGYTDVSYKDVIRAYRISNKEREVINISAAEVAGFKPKSGDKYFVEAILNRFSNRVILSGAVFHPGEYALEPGMTLGSLIKKADGFKEDASLERALIFRLNGELKPYSTSVNLKNILSGRNDVPLQREDSIVVYSHNNLKEAFQVKISGEVNNPGYFQFADSMQIADLILVAGGLKDAATLKRIEISRRIRNALASSPDSNIVIVAQFDMTDLTAMSGFSLQPFDEVIVRRSPVYHEQQSVSIDGEILYPGQYVLRSKEDRISDILNRAGGLLPDAYPEGAVLLRKTFVNASDSALLQNKLQIYFNKLQDSSDIATLQKTLSFRDQLVDINLLNILSHPGSRSDLLLEQGDIIKIPKKLQTVQLFGEIYFPKKVQYAQGRRFRDYVRAAGGFTSNSLKKASYVVYANGEVKSTRKVLFFNRYPAIRPGADIYIPKKGDKKKFSGQEVVGMAAGFASLALIIVTIMDRVK
ncbi:SLBB domain-containing protein [Chitinophaga rhizosphaerae]|uniref:SLBB domain-containing protein n=1 Tax=Chitinophaga rhizosphaerae TaxID=1864947 RepID=UPI0013E05A24|nr:SLBB domain-containing protein [Chitinophaga rhizosphaerae]